MAAGSTSSGPGRPSASAGLPRWSRQGAVPAGSPLASTRSRSDGGRSARRRSEVLSLHEAGRSVCEIAAEVCFDHKQLARVLAHEGIQNVPSMPAASHLPEILELRQQGISITGNIHQFFQLSPKLIICTLLYTVSSHRRESGRCREWPRKPPFALFRVLMVHDGQEGVAFQVVPSKGPGCQGKARVLYLCPESQKEKPYTLFSFSLPTTWHTACERTNKGQARAGRHSSFVRKGTQPQPFF